MFGIPHHIDLVIETIFFKKTAKKQNVVCLYKMQASLRGILTVSRTVLLPCRLKCLLIRPKKMEENMRKKLIIPDY